MNLRTVATFVARRLLLLAVLATGACANEAPGESNTTVIRNVTLIDGRGGPPRPDASVLIRNGTIDAVGGPDLDVPGGARVIDARGKFLIPGLWDAHVHLTKAGEGALPLLVANGITTVRDMGGDLYFLRDLQRRIGWGDIVGPHMMVAGPMLEAPATLARFEGSKTREAYQITRVPVATPERAREVVDSLAGLGVDFIKIREYASEESYSAVAEEAHAVGLPVSGHAPFSMDVLEGLALGLTTLEHGSYPYPLPEGERGDTVIRAFLSAGTAVTPTLVAWQTYLMNPDSLRVLATDTAGVRDSRLRVLPEVLRYEWLQDIADRKPLSPGGFRGWMGFFNRSASDFGRLHAAGVPLLAGTDLAVVGLFPGWSLHRELELLVSDAGLTPAQALASATSVPAQVLGAADSVGTVEVGKRADLVLLDSDPLADIHNLRDIRAVLLGGRYFDKDALLRMAHGLTPRDSGDVTLVVAPDSSTAAPGS